MFLPVVNVCYFCFIIQDRHWSELIPSRDNVKTERDEILRDIERKRREAVWELFKSEAVFLVDYLMVLKHVSVKWTSKYSLKNNALLPTP